MRTHPIGRLAAALVLLVAATACGDGYRIAQVRLIRAEQLEVVSAGRLWTARMVLALVAEAHRPVLFRIEGRGAEARFAAVAARLRLCPEAELRVGMAGPARRFGGDVSASPATWFDPERWDGLPNLIFVDPDCPVRDGPADPPDADLPDSQVVEHH